MFHGFLCYLAKSKYLSLFLISLTDSGLCKYHLFVWSNFHFLAHSQWIIFSTQSYLVVYFFFASLLHSLIMRLMVSFLSPHNPTICCALSISLLLSLWDFFTPTLGDGFSVESEWQQVSLSLQDSSQYSERSQQWMVSTRLLISKSSSPCTNHLVIVPNAPITVGTTITFIFHSFFQFSSKV